MSTPVAPNVEIECLFRRREESVSLIDFLHMDHIDNKDQEHDSNTSSTSLDS